MSRWHTLTDMSPFAVAEHPSPTSPEVRADILAAPTFGQHFTDHMTVAQWDSDQGWHDQAIVPQGPLQLHPSTAALHYGQEIFEGLKAYRHDDGSVWMFRPEMNARRFQRSAERLAMPALPVEDFLTSLQLLVDLDRDWVPSPEGEQNLYLRPFMFGTEHLIGVRASHSYTYCVLATPAGAYYSQPLKLWVTPNYSRAAVGGTGAAKCGGNYAASLKAADEAGEHGCGQVLWLDGAEHRWVEECGTMNIMFVTSDGELLTPATNGNILEGVTRDSLLQLAPDHGLRPVERAIEFTEVQRRLLDGTITEVFACGTAAVVTPITGFRTPDGGADLTVADGQVGPLTAAIRQHLLDIQYGRAADQHGWLVKVSD
ncbi:branched-chain amino acid aminotransferase [Aestuariimicrobium sp. T2.26MG-19.2B]|uniref:branched-chain amino acid aminotransferase n=1 Tax=Aestuariimicrobium sp. T2.26MG-19.2B TaxID=3040679 RepID=UPI003144E8A2